MVLTKGKIVDYLSYVLAIIGIILSIQAFVMGMLNPEQAAIAASVFATVSQIGSILRIIMDNLTPDEVPIVEEPQ